MDENTLRPAMAMIAILSLPVFYAGCYFHLVSPSPSMGETAIDRVASYRIGGNAAPAVFCPIHAIDRKLRSEHW